MKLKGERIKLDIVETIVIPIGEAQYIFRARPVVDYTDFVNLCKIPTPPMRTVRGSTEPVPDTTNKEYRAAISDYAEKRTDFMIWRSLTLGGDIEFETVVVNEPATWKNWSKELLDSGFLDGHVGKIVQAVTRANGLNDKMIEEATNSFLASQAEVRSEKQ